MIRISTHCMLMDTYIFGEIARKPQGQDAINIVKRTAQHSVVQMHEPEVTGSMLEEMPNNQHR